VRESGHGGAFDSRSLALALLIGVLTGLVGGAYRALLDQVTPWRTRLVERLGDTALGLVALAALFAAGAALARWLTGRIAPEAAGSGIPAVEDELERGGHIRWRRVLPVKFFAGALALASGLSLGREGPTVHMGAALATAVGDRYEEWRRRLLQAAGAGAGLTAAFTAPLAGFVFVLEELRMTPTVLGTGTALCAALASHLMVALIVHAGPMFPLPVAPTPSLELQPLFVALGIAAGLVGVTFNRGLVAALDLFERWPAVAGAALVGAVAAVVARWLPAAIGSGDLTAAAVIQGEITGSAATACRVPASWQARAHDRELRMRRTGRHLRTPARPRRDAGSRLRRCRPGPREPARAGDGGHGRCLRRIGARPRHRSRAGHRADAERPAARGAGDDGRRGVPRRRGAGRPADLRSVARARGGASHEPRC
jgi:H+/Cl- antiporter ClcA